MKELILFLSSLSLISAAPLTTGITLLPRQDGLKDGNPLKVEVSTSVDGSTFVVRGTATFADNQDLKTITWLKSEASYVRVKFLTSATTNIAIADVNVLGDTGTALTRTGWTLSPDSQDSVAGNNFGPVAFVADNLVSTFWITDWRKSAPPPHALTIKIPDTAAPVPFTQKVTASWNANTEPVTGYTVSYKRSGDPAVLTSTAATSLVFPALPVGDYEFSVFATNKDGNGPSSDPVRLTVAAPVAPSKVTGLKVEIVK